MNLAQEIKEIAQEIGFNDVKFIDAKPLLQSEKHFLDWRKKGYAADMDYLLRDNPINARPEFLLENAKTIIMLVANYHSPCPPRPSNKHGRIASYATGLDYHKVLRKKIKELVNHPELKETFSKSKFFTDAVPFLEKSFAVESGLGFRGKNTLLISREIGSYNFIAEIITDIGIRDWGLGIGEFSQNSSLPPSFHSPLPKEYGCARCTRCLDICPTNALPNAYQLDSRKCISYQTIENRGEIPKELHQGVGEWIFGCDLCQEICPYNRKPSVSGEVGRGIKGFSEFSPESGFGHWLYLPEILDLELGKHQNKKELLESLEEHRFISEDALPAIKKRIEKSEELDEELYDFIFQTKFARTPLLRPKRKGLIRNAKIVEKNLIDSN